MVLFLCAFLAVLLIKKIAHCCFSINKIKNKKTHCALKFLSILLETYLFFISALEMIDEDRWSNNAPWAYLSVKFNKEVCSILQPCNQVFNLVHPFSLMTQYGSCLKTFSSHYPKLFHSDLILNNRETSDHHQILKSCPVFSEIVDVPNVKD